MKEIATVPVICGFFLFALIFIPRVFLSFLFQATVPSLNDESGLSKAMFVLLPLCNFLPWRLGIRVYLFFLTSWLLPGCIALIKSII
jgi:hypothetical protein